MKISVIKVLLISLIFYYIFFAFYNLSWGAPFYFHPDERNIASAVSQLNFPNNLNPHFFAYGQLPIYIIFIIGLFLNIPLLHSFTPTVAFENSILIGRLISAILSIILIYFVYKSAVILKDKIAGIFSIILSTTSVAFLQYSHFATFEIWLSLLYLLCSYLLINFLKTKKDIFFVAATILFGCAVGIKLSSLAFAPVLIFVIILKSFEVTKSVGKLISFFKYLLIFVLLACAFYLISSPFNFLDPDSFINSMNYESGVALGNLPVFYTGSFINKLPVIFQFQKVLPFLLNPIITLLFIPSLIYSTFAAFKKRDKQIGVYILSFICLFLSGTLVFVKWARYVVPSIPFLYILLSIGIVELIRNKKYILPLMIFFSIIGLIFSFSFIKTVRIDQDSRIQALQFSLEKIDKKSAILSEVYDLGIVPFNPHYSNITLYNFYDLDNGAPNTLSDQLKYTNYIILPSQRIYESRIVSSKSFPVGNNFYKNLFDGNSGFKKVYETPCDVFCKIVYGDPIFGVEQTINVFDRPTVFIFKKER